MLAVAATSSVCVQAPRAVARPKSAPAMRRLRRYSTGVLAVMIFVLVPPLVRDEAIGAAIVAVRLVAAGNAVDAIDAAEQIGLRIGCRSKAVIRTRQILLRDRANDERRHDDHQLGLVVLEISAAEQRAQDRQL